MSSSDVKHDYHLVNPSPWPLIGSFSAFVLAIGFVIWANINTTNFASGDGVGFFGLAGDAVGADRRLPVWSSIR